MNTENNKLQGLLYLEEHIACKNYLTGDRALFETIKLEAGKLFIRESMDRSALVFLLSGKIRISTKNVVNREIEAGKMFLVTAGDSFYGRAITDVILLRCSFTQEIALCNKFALKKLQRYVSCEESEDNPDIALLAIHPLLQQELELTSSWNLGDCTRKKSLPECLLHCSVRMTISKTGCWKYIRGSAR